MSEPVVEAQEISVSFGRDVALEQITFAIPAGAVLAVIGPNGSGKSTLLKVILGLIRPSSGQLFVCGKSPDEVEPEWIGYVPQIKTLDRTFPAPSIELVVSGIRRGWPWRLTGSERDQALTAMNLVGADQLANRSLAELSGGELQRVYLARAIVREPRLIVLDEPATGIDVVGEESLYRFIDDRRRGGASTIVMATHDLVVASHHATHVLLLNHRQISFGKPQAALTDECMARAFGHAGHRYELNPEEGADV